MTTGARSERADFPVEWSHPQDHALSWWHERWHLPDQIGPLAFSYAQVLYHDMNRGHITRGEPMVRAERINTYVYVALGPPRPDDPPPLGTEVQPERFKHHETWDTLWLPEIQSYLKRWQDFDRAGATTQELLAHIDESHPWLQRCWEIHGRFEFGPQGLFALVGEALRWTDEEASDLVLGVRSKSVEGDDALRALAQFVASSQELRDAFLTLEPGAILDRILSISVGEEFGTRLDAYLEEFGRRSDNFHDISVPTWTEDPASPLALVKLYVGQPGYDAEGAQRAAAARRSAAIDRVRSEFAARAPERLEEFERELPFGTRANTLNEDHNYWLDQQTMYWTRLNMLEAGLRLASAGMIDERDDVFMLTLEQVRAALADPTDLRAAVRAGRDEMERWAGTLPPGELGAPMPAEMKPLVASMFGQLEDTSTQEQVRGLGASAGVVIGVARIIDSLEESHRLSEGDILVAQTTSPPWTPLFGVAGAVVTDAGGPMSHVAIVAREYGIPAVVGTVSATRQIADGQRIRVDGSAGTVDLLADE